MTLGAAQWAAGDTEAGERVMRDGLARLEARFPNGHADLAAARVLLATALTERSRDEARRLFQKTLGWREIHFGPTDRRTVAVRHALDRARP